MTGLNKLRLAAGLVVAGAALIYSAAYWRLPGQPTARALPAFPVELPVAAAPAEEDWAVVQGAGGGATADLSPLAQRFRLVGTFFAFAEAGESSSRLAVLDDLEKKRQSLVREKDQLDDMEILRILPDRVLVASKGQQEELRLSFLGAGNESDKDQEPVSLAVEAGEETALETSRFGRRVAEDRWLLSRQALMDYYQELADNPERLASLFLTMKPNYEEADKINGYIVDVQGEADFLAAMGLHQNDLIRKVNSMNMSSQRRAEYFISEFMQDRVSAIVLDIERENSPQKLIYLIR